MSAEKGLKNRSLLLKNTCDLIEEDKSDLRELLNTSPCLNIAYELKEELRNIYETSTTIKMGLRKIKKWLRSAQFLFGSTVDTLEKHLQEICNYFANRTTSGVKLIKIEQTKKDGSWSFLDDVEVLILPDDLNQSLLENQVAKKNFETFPPSSKRGILEWIKNAKRPETRAKRIQDTVQKAAQGIKANY